MQTITIIGSLAVIVGAMFTLSAVWLGRIFAQIDGRFQQMDRRFEQIDRRFDRIDRRFDRIDDRLDRVISGELRDQD